VIRGGRGSFAQEGAHGTRGEFLLRLRRAVIRVPGTVPASAQPRQGEIRGELAASVPDGLTGAGHLSGQPDRVPRELARFLVAAPFPDQCSFLPQLGEEAGLAPRGRRGFLDVTTERDPRRLGPAGPRGTFRLGAGRPDRSSVIRRGSHMEAELPFDRQARPAGTDEVVVDIGEIPVLAGQRRRDVSPTI